MSKQDNKKPNQMVMMKLQCQSVSLLMEIHQLLVVVITLYVYGMQRQDKKLNPLIKTRKIFFHNLRFHSNKIAHYKKVILFFLIFQASNYITTLLISQQAIFQAQGALILRGEFINQSGIDLKTLFKQKGSCILQNQLDCNNK
ncbi:unnamed protein product [Paramecium primaurelia]|uniref:Transmembrane protein n=1 Tax=Paramecium primaurelia TaxID=5886 RepID=A0A8S1QPX4_PARPR|nr:unnamed protein product [Paramecium primaurelia]